MAEINIINTIQKNPLLIVGAILGGLVGSWEGAFFGGLIGFILDSIFR
jgi:hypothetical protein